MSTSAPAVPSKPKTSGLAITSLILGIVGPCSLGLLSIVGLILGIMASKKIKASGGAIGGRGLAIAGIIVSIIGLSATAAIIVWAYAITGEANQMNCIINMRQLGTAAMQYSTAHKGQCPPVDTWPEVLKKSGLSDGMLTCPGNENTGRAYAMNAKLGGKRLYLVRPSTQTVLFFECSPGAPPSGGPSDLPPEPPHTGGWPICFCDGHTELVPRHRLDQLIWEPSAQ